MQGTLLATVANLTEDRDNITGAHVERTAFVTEKMIRELIKNPKYAKLMKDWDIAEVSLSTLLHDVRKIAIPDAILGKPSRLTINEFTLMKEHVIFGLSVLDRISAIVAENKFLQHARFFIETHHEKYDGTGYPTGISGDYIPLQGRILAVADVYDTLVSTRPYKEPMSHSAALETVVNLSGTHFAPDIVEVFVRIFDDVEKQYEVWAKAAENKKLGKGLTI
jgi:putative two-component system response regulator